MKKLTAMRHGRAANFSRTESIDRSLDETGILEVYNAAHFLKANAGVPDKIYCSNASRALTTAYITPGFAKYLPNR